MHRGPYVRILSDLFSSDPGRVREANRELFYAFQCGSEGVSLGSAAGEAMKERSNREADLALAEVGMGD